MAKRKERKRVWFYIAVIIGFLLIYLLIAQFLGNNYSSGYDKSNYQDSLLIPNEISINGIRQTRTLNYPSQTISLNLNGQDNVITVTKETELSSISLNGLRNTINLCQDYHSPTVTENGIDNNINYLTC